MSRRKGRGLVGLWHRVQYWLVLQRMWGLNPFHSRTRVARVAGKKWTKIVQEAGFGLLEPYAEMMIKRIVAEVNSSPEQKRRTRLEIGLIDWRRGGY